MVFFKKNTLWLSLALSLMVTAHAVAFTCPSASAFTNLTSFNEVDGDGAYVVWEKYTYNDVDYFVRPLKGKTYQYTMQNAQPHLLVCPGAGWWAQNVTTCVYSGPHLHHVLSCAEIESAKFASDDYAMPPGMALVLAPIDIAAGISADHHTIR